MSPAFSFSKDPDNLLWFSLSVRTRRERMVELRLRDKGYECFLPTFGPKRKASAAEKTPQAPYFPGYLFCRLDPQYRLPILKTPDVSYFVGYGKVPIPIPDSEIAAIRALADSRVDVDPWPYLNAGDRVTIIEGPLSGLEGILISCKGSQRVVVSVNLLQRSIAAEVDADMLSRTPAPAAAWPSKVMGTSNAAMQ